VAQHCLRHRHQRHQVSIWLPVCRTCRPRNVVVSTTVRIWRSAAVGVPSAVLLATYTHHCSQRLHSRYLLVGLVFNRTFRVGIVRSLALYVHTYIKRIYTAPIKATASQCLGVSALVSNRIKQVGFKHSKTWPGCMSAYGRLFHIFGPEFLKLLSPNRVFVQGTTKVLVSAERRWRSGSDTRRQSSATYGGARPASDWKTDPVNLKRMRWRSGNQWSWRDTSVMCLGWHVPVTRRAAAFCTDCNHRSNPLGMPYNRELQ